MELSSRKTSKRTIEPVDEWLQNEGYYRKHAPKDPTCLFRAVSEQVYENQRCHIKVRKECVDFMKENREMFEEKISIPFDNYMDQMACFTEWGGMNEILAMSLLFKRNVVIFHGQKLTKETVIDHGFKNSLFLCFTPPKQYETVYTQEYTANAGFCQSIVYQTLYKNVFKMNNVDVTVHKMLHERSSHLRHDKFFLKGNLDIRNQLTLELIEKIEDGSDSEELQLLSKGITPFPYRVAKALDPNIYRNIDYDIWHEIRREVRNSGYTKFNSTELQVGAKCLVLKEDDKINNNFLSTRENWDNSKASPKPKDLEFYTGHIQEMSKNKGPVVVYIVELGENKTVPYESLKTFPQKKVKQNNCLIPSNKRNVIAQTTKWKKPWNSTGRKIKDQISTDNNVDKNLMNNSKPTIKNPINKSEWNVETTLENHSAKIETENYASYKEYNVNTSIDNVRTVHENTQVEQTVEQAAIDKKSKSPTVNTETYENFPKKNFVPNLNHDSNQPNKQHSQRSEKNEIFYPPYSSNAYSNVPRFSGDSEIVNYDLIKTMDMEGSDIPYSDPATVRHFFNLGLKYFWSQNMWANGTNGQSYGDNSYYMAQSPVDVNHNSNVINGSISNGENVNQTSNTQNNNSRNNNRSSPPRHRDQENPNANGSRSSGQKSNYRSSEFRSTTSRDLQQSPNTDVNRNRIDYKNANYNEQQQQQSPNNKEIQQRGNKSNGVAPRFKKNYEGRNRNEHHNGQHSNRQQHQQDYEYRVNKKPSESQSSQCEINDATQMQHQQQQQQPQQQQQQQQQQQPPVVPPQTSPPLNSSYAYPMPYNQQVPYVSMGSYPAESEMFTGAYYPPPAGFIQVPYMPSSELPDNGNLATGHCGMPAPVYPTMENFPGQYPPVYSQYVYHQPAIYPNQPPAAAISDGCYPPYPGQPYFVPYSPMPPSMTAPNPPNPQSAPAH